MKQNLYAADVDLHSDIYKFEIAKSKLLKNLLEEQREYLLDPTLVKYKIYQKSKKEIMNLFDLLEKDQDYLDNVYRYIMFGSTGENLITKERGINQCNLN